MLLLHSLGVPIYVVHILLNMGVGIHGGCWRHNLVWIGQRLLDDNISSIVYTTVQENGMINTHRVTFSDVF